MSEDTLYHSSQLLYSEDLPLTEEMGLKRRLLTNYMDSKAQIDDCYGSVTGAGDEVTEAPFGEEDFDWASD